MNPIIVVITPVIEARHDALDLPTVLDTVIEARHDALDLPTVLEYVMEASLVLRLQVFIMR